MIKDTSRAFHRHRQLELISSIEEYRGMTYQQRCRLSGRAWKIEHREQTNQISQDWRNRSRNWISRYNKQVGQVNGKAFYENLKRRVFSFLGDKCTCCGETEPGFLNVDHIVPVKYVMNGKRIKGLSFHKVYTDALTHPEKYRLMCSNCNQAIRFGRICPHKRNES